MQFYARFPGLSCIIYFTMISLSTVTSASSDTTDDCNSGIKTIRCHTRSCSQQKRAHVNGDEYFNCSIGQKYEMDEFRRNPTFHGWIEKESDGMPKLTSIDYIILADNTAFSVSTEIPLDAKAIYLNLSSVSDLRVQDSVYYNCPRERIFKFLTYNPVQTEPRELHYDCLFGVKDAGKDGKVVYLIYVRALPGSGLTYTVTSYHNRREGSAYKIQDPVLFRMTAHYSPSTNKRAKYSETVVGFRESTNPNEWKPVIAAALVLKDGGYIHVVIEKPPVMTVLDSNGVGSNQIVQVFRVELFYQNELTRSAEQFVNTMKTNTTQFPVKYRGNYTIKVTGFLSRNNNTCCHATSYYIVVPETFPEKPYAAAPWDSMKKLAIIIGCTFGFIALGFMAFIYWKQNGKPCSRQQISLAIVAIQENSAHCEVVKAFVQYLKKVLPSEVLAVYIEGSHEDPGLSGKRILTVDETFELATHAIFVCSKTCAIFNNTVLSDDGIYVSSLQKAVERSKVKNDLHVYAVLFPHYDNPSFIHQEIKGKNVFHLMSDIESFYKTILAVNKIEPWQKRFVTSSTYSTEAEGDSLRNALDNARIAVSHTHPIEDLHRKLGSNPTDIPNGNDQGSILQTLYNMNKSDENMRDKTGPREFPRTVLDNSEPPYSLPPPLQDDRRDCVPVNRKCYSFPPNYPEIQVQYVQRNHAPHHHHQEHMCQCNHRFDDQRLLEENYDDVCHSHLPMVTHGYDGYDGHYQGYYPQDDYADDSPSFESGRQSAPDFEYELLHRASTWDGESTRPSSCHVTMAESAPDRHLLLDCESDKFIEPSSDTSSLSSNLTEKMVEINNGW